MYFGGTFIASHDVWKNDWSRSSAAIRVLSSYSEDDHNNDDDDDEDDNDSDDDEDYNDNNNNNNNDHHHNDNDNDHHHNDNMSNNQQPATSNQQQPTTTNNHNDKNTFFTEHLGGPFSNSSQERNQARMSLANQARKPWSFLGQRIMVDFELSSNPAICWERKTHQNLQTS